jgi:phosphoribosylamine--glycine ligase
MGAVSPGSFEPDNLGAMFIEPILRRFGKDGTPYVGVLFAGLMFTEDGPKCLEYNARFGDPETQAILPRIESDLATMFESAAAGAPLPAVAMNSNPTVCVVIASKGYPGSHETGLPLPVIARSDNVLVFQAGTRIENGTLVSSGGRVVSIVASGSTLPEAARRAYDVANRFPKTEWHYRSDIGA